MACLREIRSVILTGLAVSSVVLAGCVLAAEPFRPVTDKWVQPALETPPVRTRGDSADDPAIWVDPEDPTRSLIFATNKLAGLHVYDLAGHERDYVAAGRLNNVDVRNAPWGRKGSSIVVASQSRPPQVVVFTLDHATRALTLARRNRVALTRPYGVCLYQDATHQPWVILNGTDGTFVQYRLEQDFSVTEARRFRTRSRPEGCVADDLSGMLYVGEEAYGIWRLAADPGVPAQLQTFAAIAQGHLKDDVEGLALYRSGAQTFLLASSQGDNSFAAYDTATAAYLTSFHIGHHPTIDDVSDTDGIAITSASLPGYPDGLLVVQDGYNRRPTANQNFKYVSMTAVTTLLQLAPATGNQQDSSVAAPDAKLDLQRRAANGRADN